MVLSITLGLMKKIVLVGNANKETAILFKSK